MKEENNEENEQPQPIIDFDKYLEVSGLYEKFAQNNITIRVTDSLKAMRKKSMEKFPPYMENLRNQAKKRGNLINVQFAEIAFLKKEIELFTGFLEKGLPEYDEYVTMEFIKELNDRLQLREGKKPIEQTDKGQEPGNPVFSWSGSQEQLENLLAGIVDKQNNSPTELTRQKAPPPTERKYSFCWTGSPEQLNALCERLAMAGYFDQETGKEAFKQVFNGSETNDTLHRVTWIKRAKSKSIAKNAVITMFDLLAESDKISKEETRNRAELFRKLQACFCDQAGEPLKFEHKNCSYSKEYGNQLKQIISSL